MKAALEQYLALERLRHEMTLEALAEVDEGKTLAHDDVRRWVDSLPRARRKTR
jgi:predicted transcriptional regulator